MLSISMHMQNLVKFHQFILKLLSGNEILTSIKGHKFAKIEIAAYIVRVYK